MVGRRSNRKAQGVSEMEQKAVEVEGEAGAETEISIQVFGVVERVVAKV